MKSENDKVQFVAGGEWSSLVDLAGSRFGFGANTAGSRENVICKLERK